MQKEVYFSNENRKEKIVYWQQVCKNYKSNPPFTFSKDNSALLVLDMQNYFVDQESHAFIPVSTTIIPVINNLISFFNLNNRLIIFTRHIDSLKNEEKNNIMLKFWKDSIIVNSKYSKINYHLDSKNVLILQKSKYSAFFKTNLDSILKENNIDQLVIAGVHTHLCCETTARDAFLRNYEVFFTIDATGTYNEELHMGTLKSLSHGFAVCLSSEEIING